MGDRRTAECMRDSCRSSVKFQLKTCHSTKINGNIPVACNLLTDCWWIKPIGRGDIVIWTAPRCQIVSFRSLSLYSFGRWQATVKSSLRIWPCTTSSSTYIRPPPLGGVAWWRHKTPPTLQLTTPKVCAKFQLNRLSSSGDMAMCIFNIPQKRRVDQFGANLGQKGLTAVNPT